RAATCRSTRRSSWRSARRWGNDDDPLAMIPAQRNRSTPPRASTAATFDRQSRASAETVMARACPDATSRRFLMKQLLQSIAIAERLRPTSCAVTLFKDGFRLNVGQVEAF